MSRNAKQRRRSPGQLHAKLGISLPLDMAAKIRQQARAHGAPSLSAYVTELLEDSLEDRSFDEMLDEIFREQPMTAEERAWAESVLNR